jgi:hypothetical protein
MKKTNDIEAEIDAIRDALYLETKDMTPAEHIKFINDRAREVMREFGIPESLLVSSVPNRRAGPAD